MTDVAIWVAFNSRYATSQHSPTCNFALFPPEWKHRPLLAAFVNPCPLTL